MACLSRLFYFSLILTGVILIGLAGAACGQTPETKLKGTSSISGRVTIGDKPAPGIMIFTGVNNQSASGGRAVSDADGRYHIGGLNAGETVVVPMAAQYVLPNTTINGPGTMVNLSAGEAAEGIDFKLTRGGAITGRVTDTNGRPLIEERISLLLIDENGAPARQPPQRSWSYQMYQTDDRGVYRIYGLAAGRYKVSAGSDATTSRGFEYAGYYPKTFYPDTTDIAKASIVDLNEGGEAKDIDINLGRRAATYSVSGRIVDADTGKPLAGIRFAFGAIQKNQNQSYIAGMSSTGTPTNAQGEFRLEGIQPGQYAVFVTSDRFNVTPDANPNVYSDPVPFEVTDSDVTNLEVKALRGLTLAGVIIPDGISDKKVLAMLSRLRVMASVMPASTGVHVYSNSGSATSIAPDGSFQVEGLHPGKVFLNVAPPAGVDLKGLSIARIEREGVLQTQGIDLQPGENLTGVRVYVSYGTGIVRGQVKFEGGTLPSEAMMFVMLMHDNAPGRSSGQVDSRGRFVLQNVTAGTYQVVLQIVSMGPSTPLMRSMQRQLRQEVTVNEGAETEVLFTIDLGKKDGQ